MRVAPQLPPAETHVRCATIAAVASEAGPIGEAFAASITEAIAYGGRQHEAGQLVHARLLDDYRQVPLRAGRSIGKAGAVPFQVGS